MECFLPLHFPEFPPSDSNMNLIIFVPSGKGTEEK